MKEESIVHSSLLEKAGALGVRVTGGPGGMRAISADLVLMMMWERFAELGGQNEITLFEGVSGATVPFTFWSGGMSANAIQRLHLETNYLDQLDFTSTLSDVVGRHWWELRRFKGKRPLTGRIDPNKFVAFIEHHVGHDATTGKALWPKGFSCVACCEDEASGKEFQVVFNAKGTYLRDKNGKIEVNAPVGIGDAVAASCAIPLGFKPVELKLSGGRTIFAFDGGMTDQGAIPLPSFHAVNGDEHKVHIILDVGEESGWKGYWDTTIYWVLCGGKCIPRWNAILEWLKLPHTGAESSGKHVYILAPVDDIDGVAFDAMADRKWLAQAGCFARIGDKLMPFLTKESQAVVRLASQELEKIRCKRDNGEEISLKQKAVAIEAVFVQYGFYKTASMPPAQDKQ
jgi:hypothetical protein